MNCNQKSGDLKGHVDNKRLSVVGYLGKPNLRLLSFNSNSILVSEVTNWTVNNDTKEEVFARITVIRMSTGETGSL